MKFFIVYRGHPVKENSFCTFAGGDSSQVEFCSREFIQILLSFQNFVTDDETESLSVDDDFNKMEQLSLSKSLVCLFRSGLTSRVGINGWSELPMNSESPLQNCHCIGSELSIIVPYFHCIILFYPYSDEGLISRIPRGVPPRELSPNLPRITAGILLGMCTLSQSIKEVP